MSSTHLAWTYGVLYFVLREFKSTTNPICQRFDLSEAISLCEKNLNVLLEECRIFSVPSFGNVLALALASMKAQIEANPFLGCTLISTAATHCQNLGYSHDSAHGNSSNSRRLFWSVYMLEKQISLFFGRASVIQDADVDTAYPIRSSRDPIEHWNELFMAGIKLAKIQSAVYEDVYSRTALKLPDYQRQRRIEEHETALNGWFRQLPWRYPNIVRDDNRHLFRIARDVLEAKYYSTFTTLLRAPNATKTG
ncbi:hypothetical protein BJX76DRAFT_270097 [Aspergillus varians]